MTRFQGAVRKFRPSSRLRAPLTIAALGGLLLAAWPAGAVADRGGDPAVEWQLVDEGPARLDGIEPSFVFELELPPGVSHDDPAQLVLDYRRSNLVLPTATLTVQVNGANISSEALRNETDRLEIDLPPGTLLAGPNDVHLTGWLEIEVDRDCLRPERPERWLEIDNAHLRAALIADDSVSLDARRGALVPYGDQGGDITYVVSDLGDPDLLDAAGAVVFASGQGASTDAVHRVVRSADFSPGPAKGPTVLVGTTESSAPIAALAPSRSEGGWLRIARTDWSAEHTVIVVSGETAADVATAGAVYADPSSDLNISGDGVIVLDAPPLDPEEPAPAVDLRLLGYGERTVRGFGSRSLIYAFDLPYGWSPERGAIDLEVTTGTDPTGGGQLTVLVNGRSVDSFSLRRGNATTSDRLSIPASAFRPGRNFLRVAFELAAPGATNCTAFIEPFGTVHADTELIVNHGGESGRVDLRDLPTTFAAEVDMAAVTIVLPLNHDEADISDALLVIAALSDSSSRIPPRIRPADQLTAEDRQGHLIILGDAPRQPLVAELADDMPLAMDTATGDLPERRQAEADTGAGSIGVLQLLRSPFSSGRLALVATGGSRADARVAAQLLHHPSATEQLDGQAALGAPDGAGGYQLLTFLGDDQLSDPTALISTIPLPLRIVLAIAVLVIVATVSMWIRRRVTSGRSIPATAH